MQSLHILLVGDHPMIREILASYLTEDRHVVATAANAKEALEKFQRNQFDLVITDQAMPKPTVRMWPLSSKRLSRQSR